MPDTLARADPPTETNHRPDDLWWAARIEELADDLGRLHRLTRDTMFCYRVDRICCNVWTLLNQSRLTAADRVREGMDVDLALEAADYETRAMDWLLGLDRPIEP